MAVVSSIAGAKGKGKKPKRFLESQDTLDLAVSIGELQESKSKSRSDRRHTQLVRPESTRIEKKSSKSRIKEKKAILAAERSKHKREKAKSRRQIASHTGTGHKTSDDQKERPSTDRSATRKRVSFA
ncbi:uncharacterized protein EV420DRAFT_1644903 [Desarmillaria tabescens]|uniref:Uncharacterized protein n=1 Tax=Armillaria tabescens TaxID=1929756 RepID=A0AA39K644_ARMTA|nr:uncharacterized protein EV420DRAFT_1644903 [Desarmillaria tabescens]KAK0455264.1 hypothetical protein EV420DRAFT_1644903 [Desarmillaria tabescens]